MCLSQKLLFKQSPASFLELQKSNQKEGLLPLKPMHSQQNVIKTSKRSGMLCRSVCGKCERVLGQSWSSNANTTAYIGEYLFVCA